MSVSKIAMAVAAMVTVLLLQASLIGPLTFPVPVSLPALVVAVAAVYAGPGVGIGFGFGVGLIADLGSSGPAGAQALCWLLAGLAAGVLGGLATERHYGTRMVAAISAMIAALTMVALTLTLWVADDSGARPVEALRYFVPVLLIDALLALVAVPLVRLLLRTQGIRAQRAGYRVIGRAHAGR